MPGRGVNFALTTPSALTLGNRPQIRRTMNSPLFDTARSAVGSLYRSRRRIGWPAQNRLKTNVHGMQIPEVVGCCYWALSQMILPRVVPTPWMHDIAAHAPWVSSADNKVQSPALMSTPRKSRERPHLDCTEHKTAMLAQYSGGNWVPIKQSARTKPSSQESI